MGVHGAGGSFKVVAPNAVQELFPAEHLTGIGHKKGQQLILLVGQGDLPAVQPDLAGSRLEGDLPGADRSGRGGGGTAQEGVHLGQQHPGAKGLGHIVIRTIVVAPELVLLPALGCHHDDRHISHFPRQLADGKAIQVGHHHIQNHQLHRMILQHDKGIYAISSGKTGMSAFSHIVHNNVLHSLFIFDDQNVCQRNHPFFYQTL